MLFNCNINTLILFSTVLIFMYLIDIILIYDTMYGIYCEPILTDPNLEVLPDINYCVTQTLNTTSVLLQNSFY